jgi:hypothetical protein
MLSAFLLVKANGCLNGLSTYLADGEDLAWAAEEGGQLYPQLIENIAEAALRAGARRRLAAHPSRPETHRRALKRPASLRRFRAEVRRT